MEYYKQINSFHCVPACIASCLSAFDIKASQKELGEVLGTNAYTGTDPLAIIAYLKELGMDVQTEITTSVPLSINHKTKTLTNLDKVLYLDSLGYKIMLMVSFNVPHMVVYMGFNTQHVKVYDPFNGVPMNFLARKFLKSTWSIMYNDIDVEYRDNFAHSTFLGRNKFIAFRNQV